MNWVQMFLDFLAAIAWPLAIAVIGIAFRKEIRSALSFVRSVELPGGVKANFAERLAAEEQTREAVTAQVIEASASLQATGGMKAHATVTKGEPEPPDFDQIERRIVDLAAVSPAQAILEIRAQLLRVIRNFGLRAGLSDSDVASIGMAAAALNSFQGSDLASFGTLLELFDENSVDVLESNTGDQDALRAYVAHNFVLPSFVYSLFRTLESAESARAAVEAARAAVKNRQLVPSEQEPKP